MGDTGFRRQFPGVTKPAQNPPTTSGAGQDQRRPFAPFHPGNPFAYVDEYLRAKYPHLTLAQIHQFITHSIAHGLTPHPFLQLGAAPSASRPDRIRLNQNSTTHHLNPDTIQAAAMANHNGSGSQTPSSVQRRAGTMNQFAPSAPRGTEYQPSQLYQGIQNPFDAPQGSQYQPRQPSYQSIGNLVASQGSQYQSRQPSYQSMQNSPAPQGSQYHLAPPTQPMIHHQIHMGMNLLNSGFTHSDPRFSAPNNNGRAGPQGQSPMSPISPVNTIILGNNNGIYTRPPPESTLRWLTGGDEHKNEEFGVDGEFKCDGHFEALYRRENAL